MMFTRKVDLDYIPGLDDDLKVILPASFEASLANAPQIEEEPKIKEEKKPEKEEKEAAEQGDYEEDRDPYYHIAPCSYLAQITGKLFCNPFFQK